MRINAHLTNRSHLAISHEVQTTVYTLSAVRNRSIFSPILILKRSYSLSSNIWLAFRSRCLIQCGTYGLGGFLFPICTRSRLKHTFKLPHLHSTSGVTNKEYSSTYCSTAAVVWLRRCAKGPLQVTATSFISVFIFGAALTQPAGLQDRTSTAKYTVKNNSVILQLI